MDLDAQINVPQDQELGKIAEDIPQEKHTDDPADSPAVTQEPSGKFKTLEAAETAHKELERKMHERDGEIRSGRQYKEDTDSLFRGVGGAERAAQTLASLQNSPSFRKWATEEQQRIAVGNNTGESNDMSDAEKKGMQIVNNMIEQKLSNFKQSHLDPQIERSREANINNAFDKMDSEYPDWHDQQGKMEELSRLFDPAIQENPKFEHVELLYKAARAANNDLKTVDEHNKTIAEKKRLSTGEIPQPGEEGVAPKVGSIEEAFKHAMQ
jgi:hypothetical protein|tara:strand:+ start:696 stop:1499 length:804 start_codon:yes stop_codon:yes gene_type:complete